MLLNDQQVAINRLHVAFQEASDQYLAAANDIVEDADLVSAFETLARERRQAVERLAELTREQGLLPRAADPDREQLQTLVTQATAVLTGNRRQAVLNDRLTNENHLIEELQQALALDLPESTRAQFRQFRSEVERGIDTLTQLTENPG